MPQFIPIIAIAVAEGASIYVTVALILVQVALGYLSKLLADSPPKYSAPVINVTVRGTIENRHLVFGRRRAAGVLVFYGVSGANNKYLWYVVAVAGHQVSAIADCWIDEVQVPGPNIDGSTGAVTGAKVFTFTGTLTSGSTVITDVAVPSNMVQGGTITDAGGKIPAGTTVTGIGDNTITMLHAATGTVATETITYTVPGASTWNGKLYIWKHLGTSGQAVDAALTAAFGAWNANHKLAGTAYLVVRMERDDTVFVSGAPNNIAGLVDGALLYDPRKDSTNGGFGSHRSQDPSTWEFSRNPALAVRWYLTGGSVHNDVTTRLIMYGLREIESRIDDLYVFAAANICEEVLTGSNTPPSGTELRYNCDLEATAGELRRDVLTAMLASMAGTLTYVHGTWRMYAGAYDSPTHTFTQDDLYGDMEVADTTTHTQRFNQVAGTYVDSQNQWIEQTTIFRTHSAYETQDGGEQIQHELNLRGVTSRYQAQRLAEIELRRTRMMRIVKLHGALNLLAVAQNETLSFSHARYNWTNRVFRCIERQFDFGAEAGQVIVTAQREDPAVYTDLLTEDYLTGTSFTDTYENDAPDTPTTLNFTTAPSLINFSVGLPTYLQPGAVIELWEYTSITPFSSATKLLEARSDHFSVAKPDTTVRYYWVRVRQVDGSLSGTVPATNGMAAAAAAAAAGAPGVGAITVVLSRPFVSVLAYADGTIVSTAQAFGQLQVYDGVTDVTASATLSSVATNCTGAINTATNTPATGHPKGFYQVTALTADAGNLQLTAVYSGITIVRDFVLMRVKVGIEIVTSLPSTNLFEGRTVYLTSDDMLYRYTGSAWTTAVPTSALTGTITTTQIADNSISTPKLQANSVTANEVATNAIIANKILAGAVTTAKIATNAITAASGIIADLAITNAKIGNLEVDSAKIANLTVGTGKIADGAVTGSATGVNAGDTGSLDGDAVTFSYTSAGGTILLLYAMTIEATTSLTTTGSLVFAGTVYASDSVTGGSFPPYPTRRFSGQILLSASPGTYTAALHIVGYKFTGASLVLLELKK